MAKKPNDPSRHTPPAGQRPTENEKTNDRTGHGDRGNERGSHSQLEGGKEADVIKQPGRSHTGAPRDGA